MIYIIFFLSFFAVPLDANVIEKAIQNVSDQEATSILPPDIVPEDGVPSLGDVHDKIRTLEEKVDRLEKLIEILRSSNNSNLAGEIKEKSLDFHETLPESASEGDPVSEFEKIKQLAIQKDPDIENIIKNFTKTHKAHALAAKAYFFLADYYYSQKEYEKAISLIKKGLVEYKDSPEEPRAIWILSLTLSELKKPDQACVALKKLLSLPSISVDLRDNATKQIQLLNCK